MLMLLLLLAVVGFRVFKERNIRNDRLLLLLLSELRHLGNEPAMATAESK